jgi:hypothetical protein
MQFCFTSVPTLGSHSPNNIARFHIANPKIIIQWPAHRAIVLEENVLFENINLFTSTNLDNHLTEFLSFTSKIFIVTKPIIPARHALSMNIKSIKLTIIEFGTPLT